MKFRCIVLLVQSFQVHVNTAVKVAISNLTGDVFFGETTVSMLNYRTLLRNPKGIFRSTFGGDQQHQVL